MATQPTFQYSPLCDVHHTAMRRLMVDEDGEEIRSYHACARPECTRVFRQASGYADFIEGEFDDSRGSVKTCPQCRAVLYLASVDHLKKIETWECPGRDCDFSGESRSPAAR